MSCIPVEKGVKKAADCKCYTAVMRTYLSLGELPDHVAMEAALRVYQYHHPEDSMHDASLTVERWVNEERMQ
jgi:hypothetical protein